jgi:hypothetical protein
MPVSTPYDNLDSLQDSLERLLRDIRDLQGRRLRPLVDLDAAPTINDWSYGFFPTLSLFGSVRNHPLLGNCSQIHTSQVMLIDPDGGWARTWSRYYKLGAPAPPNPSKDN